MQKDIQEKIGSEPKKKLVKYFGLVTALVILVVSLAAWNSNYDTCSQNLSNDGSIKLGDKSLVFQSSDDDNERTMGLSGKKCIKNNQVMLFDFKEESDSGRCFWMKDMNFPIDMFWLDETRTVVHEVLSAEPKDYPKVYCPENASRYVLETKVGALRGDGESLTGKKMEF